MALLLLLQVRYTMVQVDYVLNKEYISTFLCVEKDIPESTCDGKCHLKKELSKLDEQQDEGGDAPILLPITSVDFVLEAYEIELPTPSTAQLHDAIQWYDSRLCEARINIESPPPELSLFV